MKVRSIVITLLIVLAPFVVGTSLFLTRTTGACAARAQVVTDTRGNNPALTYRGITINWSCLPEYTFKSVLFGEDEYVVFVFHYTNESNQHLQVMPTYTVTYGRNKRYAANEEIAMYIEDGVEKKLTFKDQTPITFKIAPGTTKHYIVTFEKPRECKKFYVDIDMYEDMSLRIHYRKEDTTWTNYQNEWIHKYNGRG